VVRSFYVLVFVFITTAYAQENSCKRIVSLAPSITESIFEVGLESYIVGVTTYDKYPVSVQSLAKVGGFLDTNIEAIVALRPTVVFGLQEATDTLHRLTELGITVVPLEHRNIKGIKDSLLTIGKTCACKAIAIEKLEKIEATTKNMQSKVLWTNRKPRVLVVVGREDKSEGLGSVYISGNDGFYSDLLFASSAQNVMTGSTIAVPTLTYEGLLSLNPDVILEVVGSDIPVSTSDTKILMTWKKLTLLKAVKTQSVYVIRDDFATIPGPRYVKLLKKIVLILSQWHKKTK
jgi:iron complex transport system substrate-binding protein